MNQTTESLDFSLKLALTICTCDPCIIVIVRGLDDKLDVRPLKLCKYSLINLLHLHCSLELGAVSSYIILLEFRSDSPDRLVVIVVFLEPVYASETLPDLGILYKYISDVIILNIDTVYLLSAVNR